MEQNKGLGGSLVEVFDAALNLVKTEARVQVSRATDIAKAKGIGAVLLMASTAPLILGLIFLILFLFYGLIRLGLGAWAAALFIAIASFGMAGILAIMGINKLKADVPDKTEDDYDLSIPYTSHTDDLHYGKVTSSQVMSNEYVDRDTSGLDNARVRDLRVEGSTSGNLSNQPLYNTEPEKPSDIWASTYKDHPVSPSPRPLGRHAEATAHQGEAQGTLTQGQDSQKRGIAVSTTPTYKDDMKKEGY